MVACEPYIILKPISTNMENYGINVVEDGFYILESDTLKVNCLALFPETDSTSNYIVIEIFTTTEDTIWASMTSYLLVDIFKQSLEPTRIEKDPSDFSDKWSNRYEIIFKSDEEMKFPLKFQLTTLNQREYFILFENNKDFF